MSIYYLDKLFHPRHVAVIGASERPGSIGHAIMRNLIEGGFAGDVFPVNDRHKTVWNRTSYNRIEHIDGQVDLAVIATPIQSAPQIVAQCVRAAVGGAVIISGGGKEVGEAGAAVEREIHEAAAGSSMRILGPNCLGLICSRCKLNVTFAHQMPLPGKLAFISQSGAICTAILDYAEKERVGFSYFVSLGSMLDVDFGDLIDYMGGDARVSSIVMYVENLKRMRNFMSAARAVSRIKPIIALKAGRTRAGARAAASHTGAMAGRDAVYDAAFKRAGILRVRTFEELFDCAGLVAKQPSPQNSGLVIVSNAGGPAVMAADAMNDYQLEPAVLSPQTLSRLDEILPHFWSRANPIDILGDASPERYLAVVDVVLNAPETKGLLIMLAPQALTDATAVAEHLVERLQRQRVPVIAAWLGGPSVEAGRDVFNKSGISTYPSPERAVRAFVDLFRYGRNIESLQQIPPRFDRRLEFDRASARTLIQGRMENHGHWLDEADAKQLLSWYGIPVNPTIHAADAQEAVETAERLGFPVVLKIVSSQIIHKTDAGGVRLNLKNAEQVRQAFDQMTADARRFKPDADIRGVTVQTMLGPADHELILGIQKDKDFGPVLLFGFGGVLTEVLQDRSLALPPLNRLLARRMIEDTRIYRLLSGYRNHPPANLAELEEILVRLSQLSIDFAEIETLDINPLMAVNGTFCAVDARIHLQPGDVKSPLHLTISPYPNIYESTWESPELGRLRIRPIRPEDAVLMLDLFEQLSEQSIYNRFFAPLKILPTHMLARFTQIDYDREIALVAIREHAGHEEMLGVARIIHTFEHGKAEFAVLIGDQWQGKGIGAKLLSKCLQIAKERGLVTIWGNVLAGNTQMLALGRKLHFKIKRGAQVSEYELTMDLRQVSADDLKL